MSDPWLSAVLESQEVDEWACPMCSCLLYVLANLVAMLLYWLHQQSRSQRLQEEECDGLDLAQHNGSASLGRWGSRISRTGRQPSLLSVLGLTSSGASTFSVFEDRFYSFQEVGIACKKAGLEQCGLIVGVDFSASNEWQGRKSFNGQNLHKVIAGKLLNPYQKVISIIGHTLESLDEDQLIPAYGFGDTVTGSQTVFSFMDGEEPCSGFTQVLERYGEIASRVTLGGPTNLAPIILKAVDIVRRLKRYHILIVIADGQVTEQADTIQAIVDASKYPLSIVMVGVGDGPWLMMETFDDCLPERCFDNFQFVNFHQVIRTCRRNPEASFALHAMMEIPDQYKTIKSLGYLDSEDMLSQGDRIPKTDSPAAEANLDDNGTGHYGNHDEQRAITEGAQEAVGWEDGEGAGEEWGELEE